MKINYEDLIGKTGIFCAAGLNTFRIGDLTFQAIEDESDGYRSFLSHIEIIDNIRPEFREEVMFVKITMNERNEDFDGFALINKFNQTVLLVGTDNYDDYYPCFTFKYFPEKLTQNLKFDDQFFIEKFNQVTE